MPALAPLAAAHRAVLLVDSASATVQVGLVRPDRAPVWRQSDREAGIAVFACAAEVLGEAGLGVRDLGACAFCEGPGSILGIRTTAMALRTWQAVLDRALPVYAYRSLELVAHALAAAGAPGPFAVIADARRETWHCVTATAAGGVGPLRRVARAELEHLDGALFMPAGFRAWATPPRAVTEVPYDVAELWRGREQAGLLQPAPQPDAFLHEDAAYVTWSPQIHRAGVRAAREAAPGP